MTALQIACIENRHEVATCFTDFLKEGQLRRKYRQKLLNFVSPKMQLTPLGLAILMENNAIASTLIHAGALCFLDKNDLQKDLSPVFLAIEQNSAELLE